MPDASAALQTRPSPVEAGGVEEAVLGGGTTRARLAAQEASAEEMMSPSEQGGCEVLVRSRRRS